MPKRECHTPKRSRKAKPKVRYLHSGLGKTVAERPARDADGMACACGGFAEKQYDLTDAEVQKIQRPPYGFCGRSWACCARAFKCRLCKTRLIVNAHAPEAG